MNRDDTLEVATLGGGCFWCTEAVFERMQGVQRVQSGYSGGAVREPTYEQVCSGKTGHAEVVQVHFDPSVVSFREILEVFFTVHDPTTLNRQGADVGTQYRSVIFYNSPEQRATAETVIEDLSTQGLWPAPFVTEISALEEFFPAEAYHDGYYRRNSAQPYCRMVVEPKVAKFRSRFAHRIKA